MNRFEAFARMWELVERDHGGCEDGECPLAVAIGEASDHALELWAHSGAADEEFMKLFETFFEVKT